ncbi:MAG: large conductance mechanosensitive channel protein MscL [Oscillospiraceae bacterium]|nr:large conductance mechanosensitive channel protein MscL [Oscillospiraceae bacterium]
MASENKAADAAKAAAGKAGGLLKEFKEFALKGNVMDMAVGVIVGAAFQNIVNALTNSFINPLIGLITGGAKTDENGNIIVSAGTWKIGGVEFTYGAFISAVVNFLIIALVLFLILKATNAALDLAKKKEEEASAAPPEPTKEEVLLTEIRDLLKEKNDK